MRRTRAALLAAVLLAAAAVAACPSLLAAQEEDSTWLDHARAADIAYRAGAFSTDRAQLLAVRRLIGANPDVDYGLAVAEARLGDPGLAVQWLATWAAMGLWRDIARDADLVSLHGTRQWPGILARVAASRVPVARGAPRFTLPDPDMLAEDLAWDSATNRYFVSSVRRGVVLVVDSAGAARPFTAPGGAGVWAMMALGVDAARGVLWATTAALPGGARYARADSGRSALLAYDLATGAPRARLEPPPNTGAHALGDLVVAPDGTVYVSDADGGAVYAAAPNAIALRVLVPPGELVSPQTPALSPDGRRLFVADYARGVAAVDLATGEVRWLPHPGNVAIIGIDGMYRAGRDLIVVQNGVTPNRVVRLVLDSAMTRVLGAELLERGTPPLADPTHGVVRGAAFDVIANSGWARVRDDGTMAPGTDADRVVIRRIPLGP